MSRKRQRRDRKRAQKKRNHKLRKTTKLREDEELKERDPLRWAIRLTGERVLRVSRCFSKMCRQVTDGPQGHFVLEDIAHGFLEHWSQDDGRNLMGIGLHDGPPVNYEKRLNEDVELLISSELDGAVRELDWSCSPQEWLRYSVILFFHGISKILSTSPLSFTFNDSEGRKSWDELSYEDTALVAADYMTDLEEHPSLNFLRALDQIVLSGLVVASGASHSRADVALHELRQIRCPQCEEKA